MNKDNLVSPGQEWRLLNGATEVHIRVVDIALNPLEDGTPYVIYKSFYPRDNKTSLVVPLNEFLTRWQRLAP